MAEPANCTLRPLSTPPWPLLLVLAPVPAEPSEAPAATPREAEDGPLEMLLETLRSNAPALTRAELASASLGLKRAYSISRLFSSASAMASFSDR